MGAVAFGVPEYLPLCVSNEMAQAAVKWYRYCDTLYCGEIFVIVDLHIAFLSLMFMTSLTLVIEPSLLVLTSAFHLEIYIRNLISLI